MLKPTTSLKSMNFDEDGMKTLIFIRAFPQLSLMVTKIQKREV